MQALNVFKQKFALFLLISNFISFLFRKLHFQDLFTVEILIVAVHDFLIVSYSVQLSRLRLHASHLFTTDGLRLKLLMMLKFLKGNEAKRVGVFCYC